MKEKKYYIFYLEIALKSEKDMNIYAYENLSHIPTIKLIEIFNINTAKDPNLIEGYLLTEELYQKHKDYLENTVVPLNLAIFEYCLRLYEAKDHTDIRKLYKEDPME